MSRTGEAVHNRSPQGAAAGAGPDVFHGQVDPAPRPPGLAPRARRQAGVPVLRVGEREVGRAVPALRDGQHARRPQGDQGADRPVVRAAGAQPGRPGDAVRNAAVVRAQGARAGAVGRARADDAPALAVRRPREGAEPRVRAVLQLRQLDRRRRPTSARSATGCRSRRSTPTCCSRSTARARTAAPAHAPSTASCPAPTPPAPTAPRPPQPQPPPAAAAPAAAPAPPPPEDVDIIIPRLGGFGPDDLDTKFSDAPVKRRGPRRAAGIDAARVRTARAAARRRPSRAGSGAAPAAHAVPRGRRTTTTPSRSHRRPRRRARRATATGRS